MVSILVAIAACPLDGLQCGAIAYYTNRSIEFAQVREEAIAHYEFPLKLIDRMKDFSSAIFWLRSHSLESSTQKRQ